MYIGEIELVSKEMKMTDETVRVEELRSVIDKARRLTASDPDNQWCRQATIILNAAFTGNDQGIPAPPAEKKG
jgi:hypothetical protein